MIVHVINLSILLIIHQVKVKKITTNGFTSPFTPFLFLSRRYIKQSRQCFIGYPNTLNFVKNTPLRVVFSTPFSVFVYLDETLSLVFDILQTNRKKHTSCKSWCSSSCTLLYLDCKDVWPERFCKIYKQSCDHPSIGPNCRFTCQICCK